MHHACLLSLQRITYFCTSMPGIPAIFPSVCAYLKSFYRLSVSWRAVRKKRPRGAGSERRRFLVTAARFPLRLYLVPRCFLATNREPRLRLLDLKRIKKRVYAKKKTVDDDDEEEEEEDDDDDSNISDIYFYISGKITSLPLAESRSLHR